MSTKQISGNVKTVGGLDALYYHLKIDFNDYTAFYLEKSLNGLATFGNFQIISENWTKQYTNFNLFDPTNERIIARVSFKNLNTRDNLDSIMVKLDSYYMNVYGIEYTLDLVKKEITSLGLQVITSKVNRVDLNTYVYGYDFSYLEYYYFSTLVRTSSKVYSPLKDMTATIYLGSRKNPSAPLLRIYDKWLELREKDKEQDKQAMIRLMFLKAHEINLDDRVPLWNVEFELKRDLLKIYKINTVEDVLKSANMLHNDMMKRYRLLTKKKRKDETNAERIPTAPIWKKIEENYNFNDSNLPIERMIPIRHSKHLDWLLNRLDEYLAQKTDNLTPNDILASLSYKVREWEKEQVAKNQDLELLKIDLNG